MYRFAIIYIMSGANTEILHFDIYILHLLYVL